LEKTFLISSLDLSELKRAVEREIDEYVYEVPIGAVGNPWSAEKVERHLHAFRDVLVEPYWTDIVDVDKQKKGCVVVADDKKGYLLAFEPEAKLFILVMQKENELLGFGVDGDAVGCFLAR
jgi:hypothetical protein